MPWRPPPCGACATRQSMAASRLSRCADAAPATPVPRAAPATRSPRDPPRACGGRSCRRAGSTPRSA
eukprot:5667043-Prymnesium_polylepis.1